MNRIDDIFADLRRANRAAIMPYVTAGYPSLDDSSRAILAMEQAGASVVEVGIPFSDPIADGPVIAAAMHEALSQGMTPRGVLEMVRSLRGKTKLGLVAMVSESIVRRIGEESFINDAADAGIDGLIVPDIDTAEAPPLAQRARGRGMTLSLLIAPSTPPGRIETIARLSSGFVYLLARAGITGESAAAPDVEERVRLIRRATDLPIAVGFGISTAAQVEAVTRHADAGIVGSAIVRAMGEHSRRGGDPAEAAAALVRDLAAGLRAPSTPHAARRTLIR